MRVVCVVVWCEVTKKEETVNKRIQNIPTKVLAKELYSRIFVEHMLKFNQMWDKAVGIPVPSNLTNKLVKASSKVKTKALPVKLSGTKRNYKLTPKSRVYKSLYAKAVLGNVKPTDYITNEKFRASEINRLCSKFKVTQYQANAIVDKFAADYVVAK